MTTTTKKVQPKPAEPKPAEEEKAIDATATTSGAEPPSNLPPPNAAGTDPAIASEPIPPAEAPADPAAQAAVTEQPSNSSVVTWVMLGILVLGIAGIVRMFVRRKKGVRLSIHEKSAPIKTRPI